MGRLDVGHGKARDADFGQTKGILSLRFLEVNALVVLAGEPPSEELLSWHFEGSDFVVAADGGMKALLHLGVQPDLLVGDFDSFDPDSLDSPKFKVSRDSDQNSTDMEKALRSLMREEVPERIVFLGATGGRSDHFLNNLLVIAALPKEIEVILDSQDEFIRRVTPARAAKFTGILGQTISLFPQVDCEGVVTRGLEWELSDAEMGVGKILGQSNRAVSEQVEIRIESGSLLAITPKVGFREDSA